MGSLFANLGKYYKRISDNYDNTKSMSEILDSFSLLSKDYQEFSSKDLTNYEYSNKDYKKCTPEEQQQFQGELANIDTLVCHTIYDKIGMTFNWIDIYNLLFNESYKNTEKINRKVVYSSKSNNRPIGENGFIHWNGLQIIDLDIKDSNKAEEIKKILFNDLSNYHWFLGVCKSASGKGLHVWTKITVLSSSIEQRKVEYLCNFRHKYSYVYISLLSNSQKLDINKDNIVEYMDMAMAKPQQGIFISSDDDALMSTNFQDLRLDVNFEPAYNTGIESINWISHPDLKEIFNKLEWFNNDNFDSNSNIELESINNISERDPSKTGKKHYKHAQRWQLANTLTSIYGYDKALALMCDICTGTEYKELKGDVKTASIHNKPISLWAIKELNKYHGFNIKIKDGENVYEDKLKTFTSNIENEKKNNNKSNEQENEDIRALSPTSILNDKSKSVIFNIDKTQYLSDIKDKIIDNLSHITLLEAGAGYGKTEMIKSLKAKTLLILPFTSTIKAKIESSETTSDWLYYYGSKRPTLEDLMSDKSMSMTIDKFSKLNVMELDASNFEYIVFDESHLLFTSSYRPVMAPAIQRLANCKSKIIMMTGTPVGELLFLPNIKHIKVIKEDVREKKFEIHMCPSDIEKIYELSKSIAEDIFNGKKVLFPTNKGNLYYEQMIGIIQQLLDKKNFNRQINTFYYKKSNFGDDSMDNINIEKSIGNNDIIFCTTYLSVGVDICDKYDFRVYFNEQWIPQDIEQFANRLRNNNLYIKMYLPKKDNDGYPINYYYTEQLDLSFSKKDLLLARDLIKTCNDMIERNNEESKYNPIVQSILGSNKYLKYDENDCKYYIDETAYKLKVFEERYTEYCKQLTIMKNGMKYYGYDVSIVDHEEEVPEEKKEQLNEYFKSCRNMRYNFITAQTFSLLDHITDANIDIYREILKGNYDIFKDDKYEEDRVLNNLYVSNIEIVEKNIPYIASLYKFYDCDVIKDIFNYCLETKQNRINYSKLDRIRRFVNIEYNRKKKRLDFPVLKFIKEVQDWAERNIIVTKEEIEEYQKEWAAKYANTVPDVVVDDVPFLEHIYELVQDLWKVVIIQGKPKNKKITVKPFELLWERKATLDNFYGNNATKEFFLEELLNQQKDDENASEVDAEADEELKSLPDLPLTRKYKLEQIEQELKNVVHSEFNYFDYSTADKSNERFMLKQKNTNLLRDDTSFRYRNNINSGNLSYMEEKAIESKHIDDLFSTVSEESIISQDDELPF